MIEMTDLLKIAPRLNELISIALEEDIENGDITSEAIFSEDDWSEAYIQSKDRGIICGVDVVKAVYQRVDSSIKIISFQEDGSTVSVNDIIMSIQGPTKSVLIGERIALNFMQRMSGIANLKRKSVMLVQGTIIKILDTRKTIPGFRGLDKYAVKIGGGVNHRMGLYDMIMIKDNHIKAAGSIKAALDAVRLKYEKKYTVEIEVKTPEDAEIAVNEGANIIMLDNMDIPEMNRAIELIDGRAKIEVSGNVDTQKIEALRGLRIDYISSGALTHSVKAFDLSMKFK
jgi:nicotinate-nucleotide pyrophosphorylase (carboxylating)